MPKAMSRKKAFTDKERLDWLTKWKADITQLQGHVLVESLADKNNGYFAKSPRTAIDAAMSTEAKAKGGRG